MCFDRATGTIALLLLVSCGAPPPPSSVDAPRGSALVRSNVPVATPAPAVPSAVAPVPSATASAPSSGPADVVDVAVGEGDPHLVVRFEREWSPNYVATNVSLVDRQGAVTWTVDAPDSLADDVVDEGIGRRNYGAEIAVLPGALAAGTGLVLAHAGGTLVFARDDGRVLLERKATGPRRGPHADQAIANIESPHATCAAKLVQASTFLALCAGHILAFDGSTIWVIAPIGWRIIASAPYTNGTSARLLNDTQLAVVRAGEFLVTFRGIRLER